MRLLLGIGACGNYLAGVKVIGQWFPTKDSGLAACCFNGGSLAGAILAPPLVTFLMCHYGWQSGLRVASVAGMLWLLPWWKTYWEPWRYSALPGDARAAALARAARRELRDAALH